MPRPKFKNDLAFFISKYTIFSRDEIMMVYNKYKSFDLILDALEFSEQNNIPDLEDACRLFYEQYGESNPQPNYKKFCFD